MCLWTPGVTHAVWGGGTKCVVRFGRAAAGQHSGGARLTHTYPCAGLCGCEIHHMCVRECLWVTEMFEE